MGFKHITLGILLFTAVFFCFGVNNICARTVSQDPILAEPTKKIGGVWPKTGMCNLEICGGHAGCMQVNSTHYSCLCPEDGSEANEFLSCVRIPVTVYPRFITGIPYDVLRDNPNHEQKTVSDSVTKNPNPVTAGTLVEHFSTMVSVDDPNHEQRTVSDSVTKNPRPVTAGTLVEHRSTMVSVDNPNHGQKTDLDSVWKATLFMDCWYKGDQIDLESSGCMNLPSEYDNHTSSIKTHNYTCVKIWEDKDCSGDSREIKEDFYSNANLISLEFNDKISSLGKCSSAPREVNHRNYTHFSGLNPAWQVTLFIDCWFKGPEQYFESSGCMNLPIEYDNQISSIKTHNNTCVKIWEDKDCSGASEEIKPDLYGEANLYTLEFNDKISSIGDCSSTPLEIDDNAERRILTNEIEA